MKYKSITIFSIGAGTEGQSTLLFKDITNFSIDSKNVTFDYVSQSTKAIKSAIFFTKNISGLSWEVTND